MIYEHCVFDSGNKCIDDKTVTVKPVRHDELSKMLRNPFKMPSDYMVFRIDYKDNHQLLSYYPLELYFYRYIKFPQPIIISRLTEK